MSIYQWLQWLSEAREKGEKSPQNQLKLELIVVY
jgi:hypothetical protein